MGIEQKIKNEIVKLMETIDFLKHENILDSLEKPPQEDFGDLASNICFLLSKKLKQSPQKIAEDVVKKIGIPKDSFINKIETKTGYVNFFFNYPKLAELTLKTVLQEKENFGFSDIGKNKKVIVEFPSVNPGKPWHIGHARNAILGDSIQRILRFCDYDVEAQDYIDDLGLQVAQVIWGYLNIPKNKLPKKEGLLKKEDQWQGRLYVQVANMFVADSNVEKEVREIMKKMEKADSSIKNIHQKLVEDCLKAQYETAFRLGIYHDLKIHETDIVNSGLFERAVKEMKKSDKVVIEESGPNKDCLVAKLEELPEFKGMKSADKVLIRSDGTSVYTGKDVAFQMWKFGLVEDPLKYKVWIKQPNGKEMWTSDMRGKSSEKFARAHKVINVIGSEQSYTQKVVYHVLKLMGYKEQFKNSFHLAYEHVLFKEKEAPKHFSGRKGTWVDYSTDEVLDRIVKLVLKKVEERNKKLPQKKKQLIAKQIGVAALRYVMLSIDWQKQVSFSYEEVLSFEGNTGPYLQYAHTRCNGILKKARKWKENFANENMTYYEKKLIKKLIEFPNIIEQTGKDLKPHYLCNYVYELADIFSEFYHNSPVLKAETEKLRNFRLTLVKSTQITLKNGLSLLGIETPEIM